MEDGHIICPRRRPRKHDYGEVAAKGCYSVIFVVLALIVVRPLMVSKILDRAEAYSAFRLYEESRRQCEKALLLDGDNSRGWHQLARIHLAEGGRDMAYGAYQKATQADARNKPAHFELGMMYAQDGRHQLAIPCFEQVRKLGPDRPEQVQSDGSSYHKASLDMLALCYEKVGDITKAEFTLEEIRVFYPTYAKADTRLDELKEQYDR
jgi:tetratricopeptide (TPR) repeat protein